MPPCLGFATPPPSTRVASARPTITLRRLVALSFVWSFMDLLIVVLLLSISLAEPVKSWMAPPLMCVFFSGSDSFYPGIHGSDGLSDGVQTPAIQIASPGVVAVGGVAVEHLGKPAASRHHQRRCTLA